MRKQHLLIVFVFVVAAIILLPPTSAEPNFFCISVRANPTGDGRYNITASGSSPFWSIRSISEEVVAGPQTSGIFPGVLLRDGIYIVYLADFSQGPWYSTSCQFSIVNPSTPTRTPTVTESATVVPASTLSSTSTRTPTGTATKTPTLTSTRTPIPTITRTPSLSNTITLTPTFSPTASVSTTPTISPTGTITLTPTPTLFTPTVTVTVSKTVTVSLTVTQSRQLLLGQPTVELTHSPTIKSSRADSSQLPEVPNVGSASVNFYDMGAILPWIIVAGILVNIGGRRKYFLVGLFVVVVPGFFFCGLSTSLLASRWLYKNYEAVETPEFYEDDFEVESQPTKYATNSMLKPDPNDRIKAFEINAGGFRLKSDRIEDSFGWCFKDEILRIKFVKGFCPSGVKGTYAWDIPGEKGKIIVGKIANGAYPLVSGETLPVFGGHSRSIDDLFGHSFSSLENVVTGDKLTLFTDTGIRYEYEYFASKYYPIADIDLKRLVFGEIVPLEVRAEKRDLVLTFTCAGDAKDGRFSHRLLVYWRRLK